MEIPVGIEFCPDAKRECQLQGKYYEFHETFCPRLKYAAPSALGAIEIPRPLDRGVSFVEFDVGGILSGMESQLQNVGQMHLNPAGTMRCSNLTVKRF